MLDDETQPEEQEPVEQNPLDLSDDDFNELSLPDDTQAEVKEEEPTSTEEEKDVEEGETDEEGDSEDEAEEELTDDSSPENIKGDKVEATDTEETTEATQVDFEAEYKKILSPFRANGKDMQVATIDDAMTLMKMGANYNKKMAGLKPNLKLLKMLENNGLLDEGKLSYLIDLEKKDPGAVKKAIKDSGIDPLDIDTEEDTEYKPNTYTVNDKEVELDGILDEIRDTQSFQSTIDIIGNKWDDSSKQILLENPAIIKVINDHVGSGIYEQINKIVESERMMGRLTDISDLDAYKRVGDAIQANDGFTKPNQAGTSNISSKAKSNPKLKNRKKAASATKGSAASKVKSDYNPLALSDEEFEKITGSQYM